MASSTFAHGRFRGGLRVRQWMMPESEETPVVCLSKPLAVFHRYVDAIVLTVEIAASGWFLTRAVWKSRGKNSSQFFYNDGSFGKGPGLQIRIDVLPLNVDVVIFGGIRVVIC